MNKIKISIVIPVYGCYKSLHELYKRLNKTLSTISSKYEIILVNDASPDESWNCIRELAKNDDRVKGINLSRNFGQHWAITAGLDYAKGDWIVVIDCDLQDQPEEIIKLYNKAQEGYDIVFGRRVNRQDSFFKRLSSKLFYKVYEYFSELKVDNSIANFSIISEKVLKNLNRIREGNRSYPHFINWMGYKRIDIDIEHAKRTNGKTSYTFSKLITLAINNIISQSNKPLILSIKFGFLISFFSMIAGAWLIVRYFIQGISVEGWTSVMVSIYFIAGLIFTNMGILGIYIGKIFEEVKDKPLYIIDEMTFDKD